MSVFRKEKRKIYWLKIKGFWEEFGRNKIGILGLIILLGYLSVAILTPVLTPYHLTNPPVVASKFAPPQWITIFSAHRNLNPTLSYSISDMSVAINSSSVSINKTDGEWNLHFKSNKSATVVLFQSFEYEYDPPEEFRYEQEYSAELKPKSFIPLKTTQVAFTVLIKSETENQAWKEKFGNDTWVSIGRSGTGYEGKKLIWGSSESSAVTRSWIYIQWPGGRQGEGMKLYDELSPLFNPTPTVFSRKGKYYLYLEISFSPPKPPFVAPGTVGESTIILKNGELRIMGEVWGLLGTNAFRQDVWTLLIAGVRISLIVGGLAALIATTAGILWGVISGYLGGVIDEAMMRLVDILLCLPVLPLLIILIGYFEPSVFHVVLLIAIFGWQGLSRIIRSRVLSIRELPFIESARAAGGSDSYVMTKHIIPNVIPVALASMVLSVPGAILTEAALSFLGFGDPRAPTWGRMLHRARGSYAFHQMAWWYVIPPGLAITLLCLAFVFISHAVDEIVNPKLRRRR